MTIWSSWIFSVHNLATRMQQNRLFGNLESWRVGWSTFDTRRSFSITKPPKVVRGCQWILQTPRRKMVQISQKIRNRNSSPPVNQHDDPAKSGLGRWVSTFPLNSGYVHLFSGSIFNHQRGGLGHLHCLGVATDRAVQALVVAVHNHH